MKRGKRNMKKIKIEKYKTAGWKCREHNCEKGEDEFFSDNHGIKKMRARSKYHHSKTGHEVHFVISVISEYK